MAQDLPRQARGAFDVIDDHRTRVALQHVGREQHQQPVRIDDLAGLGDHAEAVAIAIEGEAEIRVELLHHLDQGFEVARLARVRMVVGEVTVDIAEQRGDVGTDGLQHLRADLAGNAVAGIDHDFQTLANLDVAGNPLHIIVADVAGIEHALRRRLQ